MQLLVKASYYQEALAQKLPPGHLVMVHDQYMLPVSICLLVGIRVQDRPV